MASNGTPDEHIKVAKNGKSINGKELSIDTEATLQFLQKACEQISSPDAPNVKAMVTQWRSCISFCQEKLTRWAPAQLPTPGNLDKSSKQDTNVYTHNFQDLPAEIHLELTKYLAASDIKNLSNTGTKVRLVYNSFRWTRCVVVPDKKPGMVMHYLRSELEDCYSAHDPVPLQVFLNPTKFSWFKSSRVEKMLLCAHIDQQCQVDDTMFSTPFSGSQYPNLDCFTMVPQLDLKYISESLDSPFIKTLLEAMNASEKCGRVPFWDLRLVDHYNYDLEKFFSHRDLTTTLRQFTFTNRESFISTGFIKNLELPQLVSLTMHNLSNDVYCELLRRVHFWPKLEHLNFFLEYSVFDEKFTLQSAIKEITELPTTLKSCNMLLEQLDLDNEIPNGHEILIGRVKIDAVTWIEDSEMYVDMIFNILDVMDLPRLKNGTIVLHPLTMLRAHFQPLDRFGSTLTHLQLKIEDSFPMNFLLWVYHLENLRVFKINLISMFENTNKLNNMLVLLSRRFASGEQLSEAELHDFFEFVVPEYQAEIDIGNDAFLNDRSELQYNPTVQLCVWLTVDPIGLALKAWEFDCNFGKDFNCIVFMEALFECIRARLPALEYLFIQTTEQVYPWLGLQLLLTRPPLNIKQVLLQNQTGYPHPVLPQVDYRMNTTEFCFSNVLFDFIRKRKFPLAEHEPSVPLYREDCMLDEFDGWI